MVLKQETRWGITWGQAVSLLTMAGALVTVYVQLEARIAALEIQVTQLEKGRQANVEAIQRFQDIHREDIKIINEKLDKIIYRISEHQ